VKEAACPRGPADLAIQASVKAPTRDKLAADETPSNAQQSSKRHLWETILPLSYTVGSGRAHDGNTLLLCQTGVYRR